MTGYTAITQQHYSSTDDYHTNSCVKPDLLQCRPTTSNVQWVTPKVPSPAPGHRDAYIQYGYTQHPQSSHTKLSHPSKVYAIFDAIHLISSITHTFTASHHRLEHESRQKQANFRGLTPASVGCGGGTFKQTYKCTYIDNKTPAFILKEFITLAL